MLNSFITSRQMNKENHSVIDKHWLISDRIKERKFL